MNLLQQLSSQIGDRSEQGNRRVTALILDDPSLIDDIMSGLHSKNAKLLADCAEVCTMLAESRPDLVAPLADQLTPLLQRKNTRVRWEAMHALALVTPLVLPLVSEKFADIASLFRNDTSVIVRDYAVICAGNLAAGGPETARMVYPFLKESLSAYQTKHARLALLALAKAAPFLEAYKDELQELANLYLGHVKPSIKQAARKLIKVLE